MSESTSRPHWILRVRERFEAAHALRSYQGAPETIHGHSWQVEVTLRTAELDAEGMGYDFVALKRELGALVRPFDHGNINEVPPFDELTPTTEHLARWLAEALLHRLPDAPIVEVTVWEGPDCSATWVL